MNIDQIQKQLEQEHKALDQKFKFISELQSLMKKHGQSSGDLLAILSENAAAPARKGRPKKAAAKKTTARKATAKKKTAAKKPGRKQSSPRPLRKFKNPKTGEVAESKAPQVDKTIKTWAKDLKVDWQTLEV